MAKTRAVAPIGQPPPPYVPPVLPVPPPAIPEPGVSAAVSSRIETREITLPTPDDGVRYYACGEQWIAGKIQYEYFDNVQQPNEAWAVIELCVGECDGLIEVIDPQRPGPLASAVVYWYPGTDAGTVDSHLAAADSSWNEPFAGTCHAVVHFYNFSTYWNLQFPNLLFHMRTRKVINCDTGTKIYSTWVWDQWYDYLLWKEGKALPPARVDQAAFAAAKAADIAAGRPFNTHMFLADSQDPDDVIQTFRLMANAFYFFDRVSGKYTVVPDRPGAAIAASYGDHQRSTAVAVTGARSDILERPNKITIWHTDITTPDRAVVPTSYPPDDSTIPEPIIEEEHRLPCIYDPNLVQILLVYIYGSHQYDLRVNGRWNALTEGRKLGDVVSQYIPKRGQTVIGRVIELTPRPDNTYDYTLLEHNDAKFSASGASSPAKTPSSIPPANAVPANVDVAFVTISEEPWFEQSGVQKARGKAVLKIPNAALLDRIEIHVSINGGDFRYDGRAPSGSADTFVTYGFNSVMDIGVPYTFKFVSISVFEVASSGSTVNYTFHGKTTPAADVPLVFAQQRGDEVEISIQVPSDKDIVAYEYRRGTTADTWSTAQLVAKVSSTYVFDKPANSGNLASGAWRYFVKAINAAGIPSTTAAFTDIVVQNAGPAVTESLNGFVPAAFVVDPYNTDTLSVSGVPGTLTGGAVYEGWRCLGSAVPGRYFLCRNISPATIDAEIAASAFTSLQQWETNLDAPRRGGQGLWAPLDATGMQGDFGIASVNGGTSTRNYEVRVRFNGVTRVGQDDANTVTRCEALILTGIVGPVGMTGPSGSNISGGGLRLSTNNPLAQTMVLPTDCNAVVAQTRRRITVPIAVVDVTTDSGGNASYTLPAAQQIPLGCTLSITPVVIASTSTSNGWKTVSVDNASFTINLTDGSGTAVVGATIRVTIEDRGIGGSSFSS